MADDSMTFGTYWDSGGEDFLRNPDGTGVGAVDGLRGHQRDSRRGGTAVGSPPDLPNGYRERPLHTGWAPGVAGTGSCGKELFSVILNRADSRNGH